jgi:hypothetical protein
MHLHPSSIPAGSVLPLLLPLNTDWNANAAAAAAATDAFEYEPHWKLHPLVYTAQRAPLSSSLRNTINGDVFKPIWQSVPWSDAFGDIQGDYSGEHSDSNTEPTNEERRRNTLVGETRFKALFDDEYLYIAALLQPPTAFENLPTIATFTQRNSPIYQVDSDFEVFVDAYGTNFDYKELEVNALNTVWNLCLDKPYENGGCEHSGRVANYSASNNDSHYYEVSNQITATRVWRGRLNDIETGQGATWSVEVAWSLSDLAQTVYPRATKNGAPLQPKQQHQLPCVWRINFSRVERQGRINWTWQPQIKWDAAQRRYRGLVNMHLPDAWGYLVLNTTSTTTSTTATNDLEQTSSSSSSNPPWRDAHWPAKLTALTVYYALHEYCAQHGTYTNVLADLVVPSDIVQPFVIDIDIVPPPLQPSQPQPPSGVSLYFLVTVRSKVDSTAVSVRHDRFLTLVECSDADHRANSATACAPSSSSSILSNE